MSVEVNVPPMKLPVEIAVQLLNGDVTFVAANMRYAAPAGPVPDKMKFPPMLCTMFVICGGAMRAGAVVVTSNNCGRRAASESSREA